MQTPHISSPQSTIQHDRSLEKKPVSASDLNRTILDKPISASDLNGNLLDAMAQAPGVAMASANVAPRSVSPIADRRNGKPPHQVRRGGFQQPGRQVRRPRKAPQMSAEARLALETENQRMIDEAIKNGRVKYEGARWASGSVNTSMFNIEI